MKQAAFFTFCLISILSTVHASSADDPKRIEVSVGDITLLIREKSQWTPGRIDYRGNPMTTEQSAYSTVFSFPGTGFIGTAHLENEPEEITNMAFFLDEKKTEASTSELVGSSFRFERKSKIRTLSLESTVAIRDNRLYETAIVSADEATPQDQIYHFMHAWVPTMSRFLAGYDAEPDKTISGELTDDEETIRKFYIQKPVDWVAVYEPDSEQFAVSRILEKPENAGNNSMIWNVPPTYRKYYLKCFQKGTVPAGFHGTWKMVTGFGESEIADWEANASKLAAELLKQ